MNEAESDTGRPVSVAAAVDTDVHVDLSSIESLFPHLDPMWRDYIRESGIASLATNDYPPGSPIAGPPIRSPRPLATTLFEERRLAAAVLSCTYGVHLLFNEHFGAAVAAALNDWMRTEWLDADPRFRAGISLNLRNPARAAGEVERCAAAHPGFVQVNLPSRLETPAGRSHWWPVYEAAEAAGLAVNLHAGGSGGHPITAVGWPSYLIEDLTAHASGFQTQLLSLVSEGVFNRFPKLKVVFAESGVTWLPAVLWRFDKNWKGLRREVPWVDRPPSEIVHDHLRLTISPLDAPAGEGRELSQVLEMMGGVGYLLYSSDLPHRHGTDAIGQLAAHLEPADLRRVLRGNALDTYPRLAAAGPV